MSNNIIIPTNNVEGNITSCGLDTKPINIQRDSIWSTYEYVTYQTYNICNQKPVNIYTVPQITPIAFPIGLLAFLLSATLIFGLFVAFASWNDSRKGSYGDYLRH